MGLGDRFKKLFGQGKAEDKNAKTQERKIEHKSDDLAGGRLIVVSALEGRQDYYERYLSLWDENNPNCHIVFLGNLIYSVEDDDGSIEILDDAMEKSKHDNFHYLLGINELSCIMDEDIYKMGINLKTNFKNLISYKKGSLEPHLSQYINFFKSLPYFIRTENGLYLSYSGPVKSFVMNDLNSIHDFLWAQPGFNGYNEGDVCDFLDDLSMKFMVVGNLPCDEGYDVFSRQLILSSGAFGANNSYIDIDLDDDISSMDDLISCIKSIDDNGYFSIKPVKKEFSQRKIVDETVQVRNFKYLEDLIHSDIKEIVLDCDIKLASSEYEHISKDFSERYKYEAANRGIFINSDVVIDGQGHTIDASGLKRIIYIVQGTVTLKNIRFINGHSKEITGAIIEGYGGAIHNKGRLTVINCIFEKNFSESDAGAIFNDGKGSLKIISCKFHHNSAQGPSAIKNYGKLTLTNCTFKENISKESCLISTDNVPQLIGGGIVKKTFGAHDDAFMECYGCKFINNKSKGDAIIIRTGSYSRIMNSDFILNQGSKEGHIIYQHGTGSHNDKNGDNQTLDIMGAFFSCEYGIVKVDKGFCNLENIILDIIPSNYAISNINASVSINKLKFNGHAEKLVCNGNILKINAKDNLEDLIESQENSTIKYYNDSIPSDWKGFEHLDKIIAKSEGEVHLDCDIAMHEVEQSFYEGGIELNQDNLIIDGNGHTIDASQFSRIFNICGQNITLKNIVFKNGLYFKHYLDSVDNGGGAINIISNASVKIQGCVFMNNASRNSGGVIFNKGHLELYDSKFEGNSTQRYGGVVNNKSKLTINECTFKENVAIWEGGVVNNHNKLKICDSEFIKNRADGDYNGSGGGAIKNITGNVNVYDSLFKENSSGDEGGVINNWGGSTHMTRCTFTDNSAWNGDVIYSQDYFVYIDTYSFEECEFNNNDSTFDKDIED